MSSFGLWSIVPRLLSRRMRLTDAGIARLRYGRVLARAAFVAAVVAAAPADVRAQDRMSFAAREAALAVRVREAQRLQLERASAHARMPNTMYASTPDRAPPHPIPLALPAAEPTGQPRASTPAVSPTVTPAARAYRVALLPAAARWAEGGYQGVVRIVNHDDVAGEVRIDAVDDAGTRHGPLTLDIGAGESVQLTSEDLERGNAAIGLDGAVGAGEGEWRLEIISGLDLEVRAYLRTADGFLTALHDRVTPGPSGHRVALFNPGRDIALASRLRLVNPGAETAEVRIEAIDDTGTSAPSAVRVELPPGAARTLSAHELESGAAGLAGALGSGQGRWRLVVTSPQPLEVMNLVSSSTGHLVNLSTAPTNALEGDAFVHEVPLLPAAARRLRDGVQGFVRVINRSGQAGMVHIEAFDDDGTASIPVTLDIGANEAVHLTADDLEHGNPDKGFSEGFGAGTGDWRLRLRSTLELEVLAYIQSDDGFLASMHDLVPVSEAEHRVTMFQPGSSSGHTSRLRLINPGDRPAQVHVEVVDEHGEPAGTAVHLELPTHGARTVTGHELESGTGGAGTWRLSVTADQPIAAMSLLESPAGHLANLSTSTPGESAETVFRELVSRPVVQSKCVLCHVQGGIAGATRLLFVRSPLPNHQSHNLGVFRDFLDAVENGADYVLNKIQGVGHGGGAQVPAGTDDFANMERFLALLGEDVAPAPPITPETLFDTVRMASTRKTLRRAALIFAGRIPTDAEYAAAERGPTALRATIRGLMTGPEFHEFLIRGANDRLLTERDVEIIDDAGGGYLDYVNEFHRGLTAARRRGGTARAFRDFRHWYDTVQHGFRRAPLALIAHVAENDLPYTEILTADYIMANPQAARAYGAPTDHFDDPEDLHEFKPSRIMSYYRQGEGYETEFSQLTGLHILDPGPLLTHYPHAGILNTTSFLYRYPTTATNRNRARSRWTYYHFLGLDIEKSASRTTDPVALADTNNPTMHNPACTVCHRVLDPVAGAFQNYSDDGYYRYSWGGQDSLDDLYKQAGEPPKPIRADSWEDRETLSWPVSLVAGANTLRMLYTNYFWDETTDGFIFLDRLRVIDDRGGVVATFEFEDLELPVPPWGCCCGYKNYNPSTGREDHLGVSGGVDCALFFDVEVSNDGLYRVEVVAWSHGRFEKYGDEGFAKLSIAVNPYQEGDTWYRDMRTPGFAGRSAPNPDNSVQWLARQIVADDRFAEAAVKFWWPAIMGSEVAEPPADEGDADFEGLLLAANAQGAAVAGLARGFRRGFRGGRAYNLKDLLVEIVLSKWFRADAVEDDDPVRRAALQNAGARRLLTPEELDRKTGAILGYQWGRRSRIEGDNAYLGTHTRLSGNFRLLYGGIDSDGITERARDITTVMAGVAKRHAAQVSCPVVMRDFFLLPEAKRRLFGRIDRYVTPGSEINEVFGIEADSWSEREAISVRGPLTAGPKTVRFAFTHDHYERPNVDRDIFLVRLEVRSSAGELVVRRDLNEIEPTGEGVGSKPEGFVLWVGGAAMEVPITIPSPDTYKLEVVAWANHAGEGLPMLNVVVEAADGSGAGSAAIRNKLVELYDKLLGVQVTPHSPDVEGVYRLFVDTMNQRRASDRRWFEYGRCNTEYDLSYFDGILEDAVVEREEEDGYRYYWFGNHVGPFLDSIDFSDPHQTAQAWVVVLAYLMTDYRYLYL